MKKLLPAAGSLLLLSSSLLQAQDLNIGVGAKAGTLGTGLELSVSLTETINARIGVTNIDFSTDETLDLDDPDTGTNATIDSELDMNFGATMLMLDWYVFNGTFHVTAGMVKNDSKAKLSGTITSATVSFDGETYDVSQDFIDPSMSGTVKLGSDYEPYFGIGWGRKASDEPGFALSVELGVVLLSPSVDLRAPTLDPNGPAANNGKTQADLDAEVDAAEATANDDLSDLEAWPVISVGLNYAF